MVTNHFQRFTKYISVAIPIAKTIRTQIAALAFTSSHEYWERRYRKGGTSGAGSYGRLAQFKAEVLNRFVSENDIKSVVEFGCGDGAQLSLANYPAYIGFDVAPAAIETCKKRFQEDATKTFSLSDSVNPGVHDLSLSLDVIFHIVEDKAFHKYMTDLFDASRRFVIIYSSNVDHLERAPHVRHRQFSRWINENRPNWRLHQEVSNRFPYDPLNIDQTSFANFYIYAFRGRSDLLPGNVPV